MNLLYMKYAVEVAACGSVNRAAERLYIGQPNLSRAIKELETSLGITIFERSTKGMVVTPDGEIFLHHARGILSQVDAVEDLFRGNRAYKKRFSVSVPQSDYIAEAFSRFSKQLVLEDRIEVLYKETGTQDTIDNVLHEDYKLGIIRYDNSQDKYFQKLLDEKRLAFEPICEFRHRLVASADSPLAELSNVTVSDLDDYIEITHPDSPPTLGGIANSEARGYRRHICVFERASRYDLLSGNPDTYMWLSSPTPSSLMKRYGLVHVHAEVRSETYRDILIYRKDYKPSELDMAFITELKTVKAEVYK